MKREQLIAIGIFSVSIFWISYVIQFIFPESIYSLVDYLVKIGFYGYYDPLDEINGESQLRSEVVKSVKRTLFNLTAISFGFSSFFFLLAYLQSGKKDFLPKKSIQPQPMEKVNSEFSEEEKQQIIDRTADKVSEDSIKQIFSRQTSVLEDSIKQNLKLENIKSFSEEIKNRLLREISDLRLRANINLLIGMFITFGGLYLLWTTVNLIDMDLELKQLAAEGADSDSKFVKNLLLPLLPRFFLVIFVEIFAYFFLRLYKEGLTEIKYFQNELTNIESKLISLEVAFLTNNNDFMKKSIEALCETERNFILNKGQTTVSLEKERSESGLAKNIIKIIPDILHKSNK